MVLPAGTPHHEETFAVDSSSANAIPEFLNQFFGKDDHIQCCVRIAPCSIDHVRTVSKLGDLTHRLAVVSRGKDSCEARSVFVFQEQTDNNPARLVKVLPVYASFQFTKEDNIPNKGNERGSLISLTVDGSSMEAIIPSEKEASQLKSTLSPLIAMAYDRGYTAESDPHSWKDANKGGERQVNHESPQPIQDEADGPQILSARRTDLERFATVRRTTTLTAARVASRLFSGLPSVMARSHWLNARLMDREDEFVTRTPIRVFAGTWNVHGSLPTESLTSWLVKEGDDPDFYVISLQEMESNGSAYLMYDPTKENAWVQAIFDALGEKGSEYYKVTAQQLVTILIIVVAKKKHEPFISEVQSSYVGVGIMNMLANKGGVGVRFRFHDSYLCFVGSHLAAFTENVDRRNQDFSEITKRLLFPNRYDELTSYVNFSWNDGGDEGVSFIEDKGIKLNWNEVASVFHSDHLIWLGDLNYRVNLNQPEIIHLLEENDLDKLLEYDQLSIERNAGRTFPMFDEGKITFPPTYKYDAHTNNYDTSPKRRSPSWTDRVLWKKERTRFSEKSETQHEPFLKLLAYDHFKGMMLSDHKPVYALMELKIRKIDADRKQKTKEDLVKQLDACKNDTPQGKLSSSFVEFGKVRFLELQERTLTLVNTGQVLAPFQFIPKLDETEILPSWLHVHPMSGIISPGEKVVLHFELLIDPTTSASFNKGEQKIDTILILRFENGKHFFIEVSGDYQITSFGYPLEDFTTVDICVDEFALPPQPDKKKKKGRNTSSSSLPPGIALPVPLKLYKMLNQINTKSSLENERLFLQRGDRRICDHIKRCLDDGDRFDSNDLLSGHAPGEESDDTDGANAMVDVLVAFLECLPEPVIPYRFYKEALDAVDSPEGFAQLKEKLPVIHRQALLLIATVLRNAVQLAPESCHMARINAIVKLFTVLIRPPIDLQERNPGQAKLKREKFVRHLLLCDSHPHEEHMDRQSVRSSNS
ncbi:Endonuclease/exonuclease/phosphatase [Dichotomocladium elegans]|nr:Endonuclease/exonuclease/phosphatase [Dichotomocladium elegans]